MFVWGTVVSQNPVKKHHGVRGRFPSPQPGFEIRTDPCHSATREFIRVLESESGSVPAELAVDNQGNDRSGVGQQTKGWSQTLRNLWSITPFGSLRKQESFIHEDISEDSGIKYHDNPEVGQRSGIFSTLSGILDRVCDELMPEPSPVKQHVTSSRESPSKRSGGDDKSLAAVPPKPIPRLAKYNRLNSNNAEPGISGRGLLGDWSLDFESAVQLLDRDLKTPYASSLPSPFTTQSPRPSADIFQPEESSDDVNLRIDVNVARYEPFLWDSHSNSLSSDDEPDYPESIHSSAEPYTVMMVRAPEITEPLRHLFRPFNDSVRSLIGFEDYEASEIAAGFPPDFHPENLYHEPPQDTFNETYGNALAEDYVTLALFSTFSKPKQPLTSGSLARLNDQDVAERKEKSILELFQTGIRRPFVDILLRCGKLRPTISVTTNITQTIEHIGPSRETAVPRSSQMLRSRPTYQSSVEASSPVQEFWRQAAARQESLDTAGEFELLPNENLDWNVLEEPEALRKSVRMLQVAQNISETATRARHALESLQRALGTGPGQTNVQDDDSGNRINADSSERAVSPPRRSAFGESITSKGDVETTESRPILFRDVWQPSISTRAGPASLRWRQDSHPGEIIHDDVEIAGLGKKRDSTASEGRTPPPIPPRPKRRTPSQSSEKNKENFASPLSSSSPGGSSEHRRRSLRYNFDSTSRGWKPITSKSSADISVHGDSVGRGSESIRDSLKMTPIAKPGETVDDAIARVSQLRQPERPSAEELARKEHPVRLVNVIRSTQHTEKKSPRSSTPVPSKTSSTTASPSRCDREDGPEIDYVARAMDGPERDVLKQDFAEYKNYLRESQRTGRDATEVLQMPNRREQFLRQWLSGPSDGDFGGVQWFTHKGQQEGALMEDERLQEVDREGKFNGQDVSRACTLQPCTCGSMPCRLPPAKLGAKKLTVP